MSPRSCLIYFRTLLCRSNGSINYTARTIVRLYVSLGNRAEWRATNLFWVPIKSRTTTSNAFFYTLFLSMLGHQEVQSNTNVRCLHTISSIKSRADFIYGNLGKSLLRVESRSCSPSMLIGMAFSAMICDGMLDDEKKPYAGVRPVPRSIYDIKGRLAQTGCWLVDECMCQRSYQAAGDGDFRNC